MNTKNTVIVTGDVALDTNIYKGNRLSPEVKKSGTLIKVTKGGSCLLSGIISKTLQQKLADFDRLIKSEEEKAHKKPEYLKESERKIAALVQEMSKWESSGCHYGLEDKIFDPDKFPSSLRTYAAWGLKEFIVPKSYQKVRDEKTTAWKVTEMIGWGQEKKEINEIKLPEILYSNYLSREKLNSDILVFDDGGNKFRNDKQAWNDLLFEKPESDTEPGKPKNITQIILKTSYPLGHGYLFRELTSGFKKNLTIITSIDELRKEDVLISKGVSWEQTALDLVHELRNNKAVSQLLQCRRLIVSLQSEGALYIEMDEFGEIAKCRLSFDPEYLEGEWIKTTGIEGDVFGLMACFTAAITHGFMEAMINGNFDRDVNIEAGIRRALSATRRYKITGHGKDEDNPEFPFVHVCSEIINPVSQFASAFVPIPGTTKNANEFLFSKWTILEGNYKPLVHRKPEPLFDTAFRFALFGNKELANTPFLKINNLTTYDRREIEDIRNIRNLIFNYLNEDKPEKPLSLAVFGMPGSGKSFAVKQLARSLDLPFIEFNLSQFADGELEGAFHMVRDEVLRGTPPIVFWDEFDSQAFKWLQYLLAPMQDGKFQGGQITHPIGKSIFIFAGGTSYTYETFGIEKPRKPDSMDALVMRDYEILLSGYNDFVLKKGPDFKSRLSGYLNIQGPNQLEMLDADGKIMKDAAGKTVYNESDIQYPVRRALFIRGICRLKDNQELKIDYGLLYALIKTRKYTHGSRSLEKILSYLKTKNSDKLQRSSLPTPSILNMLVTNDFIDHLDEEKSFEFQAFRIAPQIHQNWIKIGDTQGWKLEYHKDYNFLPSHMKDENIASARRMQVILNTLRSANKNLLIVGVEESEFFTKADFQEIIKNENFMELMAIEEHKGWVKTKELTEWVFDSNRNDDKKLHNCIIGWDEEKVLEDGTKVVLTVKDKNKDKDAIKHFLEVLKEAGFVIVEQKW